MTFVSKRLTDNEPIVVFTYEGKLTLEVFKNVIADNVRYIREIGEPIYVIADVRNLESTFMDMLQIMQEARQEGEGSAHDSNIKMLIFVGSTAFARMYRDAMQKRGTAFGMAMFEDFDKAVEAARFDYSLKKDKKTS
ncbi:MAG: hypothetical protein Q9P01_01770 [Anaerolineae bacterium]|nr:hypothetical protein [Anaerolineae bacterium]MDQ7033590.1 hypothetical protein [Anaerolineae bacterium]